VSGGLRAAVPGSPAPQEHVPASPPRGEDRPRRRAPGLPTVLALAVAAFLALAALTGQRAEGQAATEQSYVLARSKVGLEVGRGRLGPWRPLVMRRGAKVRFDRTGRPRERVLHLTDRPRSAGYVAVSAVLQPQTIVTQRAEVNLVRQELRRGKARALLSVAGGDGTSYQAGVLRRRSGRMTWGVWIKTPAGKLIGIRSGGRARLRAWHRVSLRTRWGASRARAMLKVDGRVVALTPRRDLSAVAAERVIVGLGRTSKRTETGTLLVRSAAVATAAPVPVAAPPPAAPRFDALPGTELVRADFESGDLSAWNGIQRVADDRIRVVSDQVKQGRYAARFEVRNGDNPIGFGDRAEVQVSTGESEGDERWYAWSTMFAPDFPSYATWQVVSQWHANANGSPPVAFMAEGDSLVLKIHRHSGPGSVIEIRNIWRGSLRRGQWQDIMLHVKWSGDDAVGFIELWIDGVPQTMDNGSTRRMIRTLYPGVGAYFKQGLYRESGLSQTGVVYHDGFRMNAG
jgi:hypothetical protein